MEKGKNIIPPSCHAGNGSKDVWFVLLPLILLKNSQQLPDLIFSYNTSKEQSTYIMYFKALSPRVIGLLGPWSSFQVLKVDIFTSFSHCQIAKLLPSL